VVEEQSTCELDHLATFTMSSKRGGLVKTSNVLSRLMEMESTTGVWTMKVFLQIDRQHITVLDVTTNKVLLLLFSSLTVNWIIRIRQTLVNGLELALSHYHRPINVHGH